MPSLSLKNYKLHIKIDLIKINQTNCKMDALRIVLNEMTTDKINDAEKIEKKLKLLHSTEEKISEFIFNVLWASRKSTKKKDFNAEHNHLTSKQKDEIWKNAKQIRKDFPNFFENQTDTEMYMKLGYLAGLRQGIEIRDSILNCVDYHEENDEYYDCEISEDMLDRQLNKIYKFEMNLDS